MVLEFGRRVRLPPVMKSRWREWLVAVLLLASVVLGQTSKDDLWKMLQGHTEEEAPATQDPIGEGSPLDRLNQMKEQLERTQLDKDVTPLASLYTEVDVFEWPRANLKIDFEEGWRRFGNKKDIPLPMVMIGNTKADRSLIMTCTLLPRGGSSTREETLRTFDIRMRKRMKDLRELESLGQSEELEMDVFEGSLPTPTEGIADCIVGRMVHCGAAYMIVLTGKEGDDLKEGFTEIINAMSWIEDGKDMSLPAIGELRVPGAGYALDCTGLELVPEKPEMPFGVAASGVGVRLEVAAFDIGGMNQSLRGTAKAMVGTMAVGESGDHEIKEIDWGGVPGVEFHPAKPMMSMGNPMDWTLRAAQRDGFLCVVLGMWLAGDDLNREICEKAVSNVVFSEPEGEVAEVDDDVRRRHAALIYNEIGLNAFLKGKYSVATKAFEKSVGWSSKDPVVVENWVNALTNQGRAKEALRVLEEHGKEFPEHQGLKLWKAGLLSRAGRREESSDLYQELFDGGLRDPAELYLWIETLQLLERHPQAIEVAGKVYEEGGQLSWKRVLANCQWTAGQLKEARVHFDELAEELDQEEGFVADHASLLLDLQDYQAVLEIVSRWEEQRDAPAGMLFTKGLAQSGLGWFKDAVVSFKRVDEMVPGNANVQQALTQAQGMLGQGTLEGVRAGIEPVPVPEVIAAHAKRAMEETDIETRYEGDGWVTMEDIRVWAWKPGEDARMTHRQVIRILDGSGVTAFSTLTVPFKVYAEEVNVHELKVTDAEGKVVTRFRKEEMYVRDEGGPLADGNKVLNIPVPALQPGTTIEFVYTRRSSGSGEHFPMVMSGVVENGSLIYGAVAFVGELDRLKFAHTDRMVEVNDEGVCAFEARHLKRRMGQSYVPDYDEWGLLCWAADKQSTWKGEAADYMKEIGDCLSDDGFAKEVVKELGLREMPDKEKLRALMRWHGDKFQYQGLEFGRRARMPARGGVTLSRGFGDCKDFSVMMRAILREAGVSAELALVHSSAVIREDLPSLDQFDHMVVYLPELGGTVLDATLQYFNTPEALSTGALGGRAFRLEAEEPGFVTMNEASGVVREVDVDREVRVDPETGDLDVSEKVVVSPAQASIVRYVFSATAEADHVRTVESMLRRKEPAIRVDEFKLDGLDDPFAPLQVRLAYRIPRGFEVAKDGLSGAVPHVFEQWLFELEPERDRDLGLCVKAVERVRFRTKVSIPDGYDWEALDPLERTIGESGRLKASVEWRRAGDTELLRTGEMTLFTCEGSVEDFRAMEAANAEVFRALGQRIRFKSR